MTQKAIELLSNSTDAKRRGFFLHLEGASIDKRSHANDAAQTLGEVKAFDDAVWAPPWRPGRCSRTGGRRRPRSAVAQ